MTIDEMISKLKIECKEQKDSVAYLETQEEYAYYIEPHRQAITACEQLAEWLEELKKLRQNRNEIPIATVTFSKKDLQKMVDEKVEDIKLDIQGIRNQAIDDFVEALKEKYEEHNFDLCLRQNDYYSYSNSCMLFESYIDDVAEQLKRRGICQ